MTAMLSAVSSTGFPYLGVSNPSNIATKGKFHSCAAKWPQNSKPEFLFILELVSAQLTRFYGYLPAFCEIKLRLTKNRNTRCRCVFLKASGLDIFPDRSALTAKNAVSGELGKVTYPINFTAALADCAIVLWHAQAAVILRRGAATISPFRLAHILRALLSFQWNWTWFRSAELATKQALPL
jgi:hypothetical protein